MVSRSWESEFIKLGHTHNILRGVVTQKTPNITAWRGKDFISRFTLSEWWHLWRRWMTSREQSEKFRGHGLLRADMWISNSRASQTLPDVVIENFPFLVRDIKVPYINILSITDHILYTDVVSDYRSWIKHANLSIWVPALTFQWLLPKDTSKKNILPQRTVAQHVSRILSSG